MTTLLKLGGELLEDTAAMRSAAAAILRLRASGPVVVVHGGGRAIDAELRRRGMTPRFADGLRVTDADTLDAVVMVLAGRTNTELVATIGAAGGKAVGLTGADAQLGLSVGGEADQDAGRRDRRSRTGRRAGGRQRHARRGPAPIRLHTGRREHRHDGRRHADERQRGHVCGAPGGDARRRCD